MDKDILRRQAIFRLTVFMLITIVIGFIVSDISSLQSY